MIETSIQITLAIAFSAISSALVGFFVARWLYAERTTLRVGVLKKEILRQRRRISEKGDEKATSERQISKMRRGIKTDRIIPKLLENKVEKKPISLRGSESSYERPPIEQRTPSAK